MFYDIKDFPFTKNLEDNWKTIRQEYETIDPDHLLEAPWEDIYNKSWEIYTLFAKERKFKLHCDHLPQTTALIENIPNLYNAGFSILGPGTHITPHVGYTDDVLRCHLGLIVPGDCAIRVGDETYEWKEGECMIFDDMVEHEAWNKSDKLRVILIMDILKK
jgi:aspartyl/asparaginyl beta-hydroxylase (cupin superfamily)